MAVFYERQKQTMYVPTNKLSEIKWNLIWQPLLCIIYMAIVLWLMRMTTTSQVMLWAVGASSLASSAYCVFAVPKSVVAHPLRIILAYIIACIVGVLMHLILQYIYRLFGLHPDASGMNYFWVTASLSVGVAMIIMIFAGAQHPPSAGMSLVMAMDLHDGHLFLVIWLAVIILVVLRFTLRNKLKNLLE